MLGPKGTNFLPERGKLPVKPFRENLHQRGIANSWGNNVNVATPAGLEEPGIRGG